MNIVIDTNIFISALIKDGKTREIITSYGWNFLIPEFEFAEIKKHKSEILRKSRLAEIDFKLLVSKLLKYIRIVRNEMIIKHKQESFGIIGDIDPNDTIFIATALACDAAIWTDDKHFKKQNIIRILTTKEILEL
jgi:predicted nucleic acid-binding protein